MEFWKSHWLVQEIFWNNRGYQYWIAYKHAECRWSSLFERVVYHLHDFEQLKTIKWNHSWQIVRVVFVVTERFTKDLIDKIATYCHDSDNIDELSFRQMMDNHYEETDYCREYLKEGHQKRWWYIEQNDYNLYYCENEVYTEYRKIGE